MKSRFDWNYQRWSSVSNQMWGKGCEPDEYAWVALCGSNKRMVVFKSVNTWYVEKQQKIDAEWHEVWLKQLNQDRDEAITYAESEA